jgi:hypothetical protein
MVDIEERTELLREATTMILYVSVVEIAELASLPESRLGSGHLSGPVGSALLAIVWGTAVGLALAHLFAFRIAAPAFRGDTPSRHDLRVGLAQLGGAAVVATVSSLPVLLLSDDGARETIGAVPALLIGLIAYFIARATGRARLPAVFYGVTALALGVVVALVKYSLATH